MISIDRKAILTETTETSEALVLYNKPLTILQPARPHGRILPLGRVPTDLATLSLL